MDSVLELCQRFGYPEEVRARLEGVTGLLANYHVYSAVLHGSSSRGEFSVLRSSRVSLEMLSDIEILVVTRERLRRSERTPITRQVNSLEVAVRDNNPLFHIDLAFVTPRGMQRLPCTVRTFEAKQTGIVIVGADLRGRIPSVTPENIDRRELNDILIWRLWTILLFTPFSWLSTQQISESRRMRFAYVLCRNGLDLLTWALPHERVLLPSFGERTEYVRENWDQLPLGSVFGSSFLEFQELCNHVKRDPAVVRHQSLENVLNETLDYFLRATEHLLRMYGDEQPFRFGDLARRLQEIAPGAFRGGTLGDRFRSARASLLQGTGSLPRVAASVARATKNRADMLSFLLWMVIAVRAQIRSRCEEAEQAVTAARASLEHLVGSVRTSKDWLRDWEEMRRLFTLRVLPAHFISLRSRIDYLTWVLGQH